MKRPPGLGEPSGLLKSGQARARHQSFQVLTMAEYIWKRATISDVMWSPFRAAMATLEFNDAPYCLRILLMILVLFGDIESELRDLSQFRGPFQ